MRNAVDPKRRGLVGATRKLLTAPVRRFWWTLRHRVSLLDTRFRRQAVIDRAIVDFACVECRIIVDVDGNPHGHDGARAFDAERARALEAARWRMSRVSNAPVMREIDSVIETVLAAIDGKL